MTSGRRLKIVFIGARGLPDAEGGAEKNLERIAPFIAARHDVTVFVMQRNFSVSEYHGARIVPLSSSKLLGTDKLPYLLRSVVGVIRERADIVHCQGLNAALLLFVYKLLGRKVVVRYGSADYLNDKWGVVGRLGFLFCEWQLRLADAVIAVTPSLAARLGSRGVVGNVRVIPNALDPVEPSADGAVLARHGLEPGRYLLSVGRITWQKDYATLIRAHRRARAADPGLGPLVIVGGDDGSGYRPKLAALAGDGVVFTGRMPRSAIGPLYANCLGYVNSSLHEGLSNAILEAVSHGAPLVVSDIVENRDLPLAPHHFFAAGDEAQLAERIRELRADPARFVAPRERFANWRDVARDTMEVYRRVAAA